MALRSESFGTKNPDPVVVHIPVLVGPAIIPDNCTESLFAHTVMSAPAITIGEALM